MTFQFGSLFVEMLLSIGSFALTFHVLRHKVFERKNLGAHLITELDRRKFLSRGFAALGASWTATHWPAIVAASEHAHHAAASPETYKFEFLTPAEAKEVQAIATRIIPSDETPGATEAGVIYFIDRALVTFSTDDQKTYREGLPELQKRVSELFPGVATFSAATLEQQISVLESLDEAGSKAAAQRPQRLRYRASAAQPLFETVRVHTVMGFLIDPETDRHGNQGGAGWTVIGRDNAHGFQPPFGFYDRDYPGWKAEPAGKGAAKYAPDNFAPAAALPAATSPTSAKKDGASK